MPISIAGFAQELWQAETRYRDLAHDTLHPIMKSHYTAIADALTEQREALIETLLNMKAYEQNRVTDILDDPELVFILQQADRAVPP